MHAHTQHSFTGVTPEAHPTSITPGHIQGKQPDTTTNLPHPRCANGAAMLTQRIQHARRRRKTVCAKLATRIMSTSWLCRCRHNSKERRVDPQIVVGLLVDRRGFPLEIGCFEGNTAETTTILPIVRAFQDRHGLADMVVVADAGMLSASNLAALDEASMRFIVGSRMTKAPIDLASHFRWHGDAFTDGQIIDTITARIDTAAARAANDASKKIEPVWDPAVHTKSWRAVWSYSRKRATRDGHTLTLQENRARAVIAGERAPRTPRFVTTKNGSQTLDEASLNRARRLAGLKGYVTNIPARQMPASEVLTSYHDLWHVEASFRMSKTDLRARPIFHHTRDAIEAHLTIVFAALAIARYLQSTTGHSLRKIIQTLRPLQRITVRIAGHDHIAADPLPPTATTIINALK